MNEKNAFVQQFGCADLNDRNLFKDMVCTGLELIKLPNSDAAPFFDTSVAAITRWKEGTNAPILAMRNFVRRRTIQKLSEQGE